MMLFPSLEMVGAPHEACMATLRPLGPNVTPTTSASWSMPSRSLFLASSSNINSLGVPIFFIPLFGYDWKRYSCEKGCEGQSAALPCFDNPMRGCLHRAPASGGALHLGLLSPFHQEYRFQSHPLCSFNISRS